MATQGTNSVESENRKSLERFSVEVWNLTQNWIALNRKATAELEILLNARLQLFYAKQNLDVDENQEEGYAKPTLTYDEKAKLQKIVVSSAEKLSQMSITIPLRDNPNDVIEIQSDSLPSGEDALNILRAEQPTLDVWIEFGLAYYRQKRYDEFTAILEVSGNEAFLDYAGVENDQMLALDILAAFWVKQANKERHDKEKKKQYYARATLLYTTADRIQMYEQNHLAGRAFFCLVEGKGQKLDQAAQQFNFVLKQNPNSIGAMMGMACITFNKKEYKTALYYYKKCLKQKPDGPADFRIGIGMCLARLGQLEKARWAFERALEIDPNNVSALVALAVLDENDHTPDSLQSSIHRLGIAYKLEPENPVVLVNLANHFFYRKDLQRVEHLGMHALNAADSEAIKAEACYQLARCFHVQKDYEKAFKYYYQATTLNQATFILPFYGLGQLHIQRGEYTQAIAAFEIILKSNVNCTDSLKVLGSLYANAEDNNLTYKQKARDYFTKYLQSFPEDIEVLIDLAQLLEYTDPQKSLSLYQKAMGIMLSNEVEIPPELINNVASLNLNQGNYEEARNMYLDAEAKIQEMIANGDDSAPDMLITIRYNLARCMEFLCFFDDAERLYKEILKDQPNYVDCMIRLGCLARNRGQIYDASMLFKEAISINPNNADPWTLIGLLHMAKQEYGPAQKKFEHILKMKESAGRQDAYSHVALGNVWLESLFNPLRDRSNDAKYYDRALALYQRALKIQSRNMWAANGLGCILAHKKRWQEARDIFSQVREATSEFFDVWVNIAHVYMETRQYVPAIQMYTNAMKKFSKENDPNMLISLARAYYASNKLQECREILEKAMIESADNILLKFNYAFILKKMSKRILENTKASSSMVNGAIEDLKTAERIYSFINGNRDDGLVNVKLVSRTACGEEARQCHDLLKQAQTYLSRAEEQDRQEDERKRQQEEERAALIKKLQHQKFEKEEFERKKKEDADALRQTFVEMTKDYLRLPEIKEEEKKARGGGGGRRKKTAEGDEFVNDSSDMGDWQGEGGEPRKKDKAAKKAARKRREKKALTGSGSDNEDDKARRKRKRAEAAAKKADAKLSAKQSSKIKSRAFLSSESDSSDGPAPEPSANLEDSPPPAIQTSDSDESSPKPKKLKPKLGSDSSNSDSDVPIIKPDSDEEAPPEQSQSASGSESDAPRKRPKKVAPSDDSDSD